MLPLFIYPQQRYSVDNKSKVKNRRVNLKHRIEQFKISMANWKAQNKKNRHEKQQKKDVEKYKEKKQTKKVQERMKCSKHKADRYNKKKPRYNFFERMYFKYKNVFKRKEKEET